MKSIQKLFTFLMGIQIASRLYSSVFARSVGACAINLVEIGKDEETLTDVLSLVTSFVPSLLHRPTSSHDSVCERGEFT